MASAAALSCVLEQYTLVPDMKNADWDVKSRIKRTNKQSLKIRKRNKKVVCCFFISQPKHYVLGSQQQKAVKRTGYLAVTRTVSFSKNDSLDCFYNRGRLIMLYRKKWAAIQYANRYQTNEQIF